MDRDKVFNGIFWKELFKKLRVRLMMVTHKWNPHLDGQFERVNQCLETYLPYITMHHP
jgi:hypothetical protein